MRSGCDGGARLARDGAKPSGSARPRLRMQQRLHRLRSPARVVREPAATRFRVQKLNKRKNRDAASPGTARSPSSGRSHWAGRMPPYSPQWDAAKGSGKRMRLLRATCMSGGRSCMPLFVGMARNQSPQARLPGSAAKLGNPATHCKGGKRSR